MKSKKKLVSLAVCLVMIFTGIFAAGQITIENAKAGSEIIEENKEMHGLWLAFCDFKNLGLYKKNKNTFTKNAKKIMRKAKNYKCNAIFLHVRAFDDAIWKTSSFRASAYLVGSSKARKSAKAAYSYDPMKILCEQADRYDLEVHAWMNPYRITYNKFYNPKYKSSMDRVLKAVKEVSKYDIDGIHFDDYFYHTQGGYVKNRSDSPRSATSISSIKRKNVNKLVKKVYKLSHQKNLAFGISPQGNYENDMHDGADVKTWLKKTGYIDYLCPQIYWTDNWGSSGKVKMFTNRLNQFTKLNKKPKKIRIYVGLALYRCGYSQSDDKGWGKSRSNMKKQVTKIRKAKYRKKGVNGFILFEADNLYMDRCHKELNNLKSIL